VFTTYEDSFGSRKKSKRRSRIRMMFGGGKVSIITPEEPLDVEW
jgi:hypothetical protein